MAINQKQIDAILALPAPKRYSHFIKKVVGWQKMWGLYDGGWAMAESDDGEPVLPLFPEKEYAELCISGEWSNYKPKEIELSEVFENVIPTLREQNILPGVFYTMEYGSISANVDELESDLKVELSKYA